MFRARTHIARRLRRDAPDTETILWRGLREAMPGIRFRRQHPVGPYIVDFACPTAKLAIELDGGQHAAQQEADAERTAELRRRGYRVVRFWNNDVHQNLAGVLESIQTIIANYSLSALQGGEGGARAARRGRVRWVPATALESPTSPRPSPPPGAEWW
ncbi:MAG: endonuclease domain-containing protein [Alphaproteobacteria bacterium]